MDDYRPTVLRPSEGEKEDEVVFGMSIQYLSDVNLDTGIVDMIVWHNYVSVHCIGRSSCKDKSCYSVGCFWFSVD